MLPLMGEPNEEGLLEPRRSGAKGAARSTDMMYVF